MSPPYPGGCACGAVRFDVTKEPMAAVICHCRACQYASGGGPAYALALSCEDVTFSKGEDLVRAFETPSDAGNAVFRSFCGDCGTPLFGRNEGRPGFMTVRLGALDDPSWAKPVIAIWTSSAQPWTPVDPDIRNYEKNYTG